RPSRAPGGRLPRGRRATRRGGPAAPRASAPWPRGRARFPPLAAWQRRRERAARGPGAGAAPPRPGRPRQTAPRRARGRVLRGGAARAGRNGRARSRRSRSGEAAASCASRTRVRRRRAPRAEAARRRTRTRAIAAKRRGAQPGSARLYLPGQRDDDGALLRLVRLHRDARAHGTAARLPGVADREVVLAPLRYRGRGRPELRIARRDAEDLELAAAGLRDLHV